MFSNRTQSIGAAMRFGHSGNQRQGNHERNDSTSYTYGPCVSLQNCSIEQSELRGFLSYVFLNRFSRCTPCATPSIAAERAENNTFSARSFSSRDLRPAHRGAVTQRTASSFVPTPAAGAALLSAVWRTRATRLLPCIKQGRVPADAIQGVRPSPGVVAGFNSIEVIS